MVLGVDDLVLDDKRVCVEFSCILGEVNDRRLLNVKCRTASTLPSQSVINNGLDLLMVEQCCWTRDPSSKVVNKRNRATICINLSLHQICIEEEI